MKFKFRQHQEEGIQELRDNFAKGIQSQIRQAPTGAGKTFEFAFMASEASKKGVKTLILSNRTELLKQAGGSIYMFGIAPSYIMAGSKHPPCTLVSVAMSQTLRRRIKNALWQEYFHGIGLLIIDEMHLQEFNPYFIETVFPNARVVGFSATPKRTGSMRQLGLDYDKIVYGPQIDEAISRRFLVPDRLFKVHTPDMTGVGYDMKSGDYKSADMYSKYNTPELYEGLIDNYRDKANGSIMLVFCVNTEHVIKTTEELNSHGITAKYLVSNVAKPKKPKDTTDKAKMVIYEQKIKAYENYERTFSLYSGTRSDVLADYHNGKFKVLVNNGILTTGYDFPAIESIAVYRATLSEPLWLQMLGRGARIFDQGGKKYFNLFDFGGNTDRLGTYRQPRRWHLWHEKSKGGGIPPMKICGELKPDKTGNAGCKKSILATYKICPKCGYLFLTEKEKKKAELEEVVYDSISGKVKQIKDMDLDELWAYKELMGYKIGWFARAGMSKYGNQKTMNCLKSKTNLSPGQLHRMESQIHSEFSARGVNL